MSITIKWHLEVHGVPVTTARPDIKLSHVLALVEHKMYTNWIKRMTTNFNVEAVDIHALTMFGSNPGFAYVNAVATRKNDGTSVPGYCLLRGDTVGVLLCASVEDEKGEDKAGLGSPLSATHFLMVRQAKVGPGCSAYLEIPAGIIEPEDHTFAGRAAAELKEETGVILDEKDVHYIGSIVPSAGGCSETVMLYTAHIRLTKEQLETLTAKTHGVESEREQITLVAIPIDRAAWNNITDAKFWAALSMAGGGMSKRDNTTTTNPDKVKVK